MSDPIAIALVPPKYRHLYQNSPSFRSELDLLARMLPCWVDGLAARAEEQDAKTAAAIDLLRSLPPIAARLGGES